MKVEFQGKAYLQKYTPISAVMNDNEMPMISQGRSKYFEGEGYPCIGDVTIVIDVFTEDKILADQVAALQSELQTVRAESQVRENRILDQISKLQALTYEAPQT